MGLSKSAALNPTVSIVMNCYNSDRFLKEAIDSIYAQTYKNWEIIFWDNASTDNSAAIAQSYDERLKYFLAYKTTPLGEARNLALQKAKGKYIAFLDCDDLYMPDKLERQVALMNEGEFALSYGSAITIDELGDVIRSIPVSNDSGYIFGDLLEHYEINMQSVMIRHSVLQEEQLEFEASMKYCPDYNLFMEIASRYSVGVIRDFIVKYRIVKGSLSSQTVDIASSEIRFSLNRILSNNSELRESYLQYVTAAYEKLYYYDAVSAIYKKDLKKARKLLKPVLFKRISYLLLYLVLILPVPHTMVLRLLRR